MTTSQQIAGLSSGTLVLDPAGDIGVDVDPADVEAYLAVADAGMISARAGNCNAVQDDRAFRDRTTVEL